MARRKYAEESLKILKHDVKLLSSTIQKLVPFDPEGIIESMKNGYAKLPEECFFDRNEVSIDLHLDDEIQSRVDMHREWGEQPYEQSQYMSEYKTIRTSRGVLVRSKSEALICESLYRIYDIPHRYEQEKIVDDYIIAPDFTFEGADGNEFYWEHLGMMDDERYADRNFRKLQSYYSRGIVMGDNLILSFDKYGTIDMKYIEGIILNEVIPRL